MSAQSQSEQAGVLVIGRVLASLSEALVLLLIVRLLGKADLGVLAALVLVYETLALILSAGFPASLMYYLPSETPEIRGALARRFTVVLMGLGALAALLLAAVGAVDLLHPGYWAQLVGGAVGLREEVEALRLHHPNGSPGPGVSLQYLLLLAPGAILEIPSRMLPNLLVVEGRARAAAGVGVVRSLGRTLFTVIPIALGLDLWWVAGSMTAFGLLYGCLVFWFLRDLYGDLPRVASPHTVRELFRFAIPLGFTDTVGILNKRLDRYLIVALFAATAVAEYEVGAWQIPFVATIPFAIGAAYTPRFRELFAQGAAQEAIDVWRLSIQKASLIIVPICSVFVVAAEETVALLFTDSYENAAGVFRIYSVWTLLRVTSFGNVIVAAGRPGYVLQAAGLSLVANILISVPLTLALGFEGPALGTLLAFIPTVGFYCWRISGASGVPLGRIFPGLAVARVLVLAVLVSGLGWWLKGLFPGEPLLGLGAVATVVLVGFSAVGTALGLIEREDWRYLWDWMRLKILR